ncbi:6-pyruvoyl tetrahydropterin synthase [Thermanaerothrix daxensis]|uniref:6-carboxy-5,6,7,8-tetrahydropterin synthase n=1 Tax=Thermanaerothrix daxensis TaxID=869279 RepID=A0A0P6XU88_9CHLR|nr:6-carboxytetrahydropterin synthase [Thermanaerothrix daxensis]KPL82600.1 6-pyruvoyl tetrahydropterin synthase [Thermanaerothrix daxensis]
MYRVAVSRSFIAQHFLIGGDWGAENLPHAHAYRVEVEVSGEQLDANFYLMDIVALEAALESQVARYRNRLLNDLPEFAGVNPSLEFFARLLCENIAHSLPAAGLSHLRVRLWEHENAWASYEMAL